MTLTSDFEPRILGFLCNWCCYAGADLAGVSRFQYPTNIRIIRVMCSGRVDPAFIFHAFAKGIDGVLIGGCHVGGCHYISGNYEALKIANICKKLLEQIGLNPERLWIKWVDASEGIRFAGIVSDFTKKLKELGPLGTSEGEDIKVLELKLQAAKNLSPYIKFVEREKLRLSLSTDAEYEEFFNDDEMKRLFQELIIDKLTMSEILLCLRQGYFSTEEVSGILGLSSAEVSRLFDSLMERRLITFDESGNRFLPI